MGEALRVGGAGEAGRAGGALGALGAGGAEEQEEQSNDSFMISLSILCVVQSQGCRPSCTKC